MRWALGNTRANVEWNPDERACDAVSRSWVMIPRFLCIALFSAASAWPVRIGGSEDDGVKAAACTSGAVMVAGKFRGTVAFGSSSLTSSPGSSLGLSHHQDSAFVSKISDTTGAFVWTAHVGGAPLARSAASALALDTTGDALVAGTFRGSATFGSTLLTSHIPDSESGSETFVAKLNGASGTFDWAVRLGALQFGEVDVSAAVDASGNAFVSGYHSRHGARSVNFSSTVSLQSNTDFSFVAKVNMLTGACEWAVKVGGLIRGIAVDGTGHVLLTGSFSHAGNGYSQSGEFGSISLVQGDGALFVAKVEPAMGTFVWARQSHPGPLSAGIAGSAEGLALAVDTSGHVLLSGEYTGTNYFGDVGTTSIVLPSAGRGGFVAKVDGGMGTFLWAEAVGQMPSTASVHTWSPPRPRSIAVDTSGDVLVGGAIGFDSTTLFGATALHSRGYDAFVAKLDGAGSAWEWAIQVGGALADETTAVASASSGSAFAVGMFEAASDAGSSMGGYDVFVLQINGTTGAFERAPIQGAASDASGGAIIAASIAAGVALALAAMSITIRRSMRACAESQKQAPSAQKTWKAATSSGSASSASGAPNGGMPSSEVATADIQPVVPVADQAAQGPATVAVPAHYGVVMGTFLPNDAPPPPHVDGRFVTTQTTTTTTTTFVPNVTDATVHNEQGSWFHHG